MNDQSAAHLAEAIRLLKKADRWRLRKRNRDAIRRLRKLQKDSSGADNG